MDKANSQIGNRLPVMPMAHQRIFAEQMTKSTPELQEQNANFESSAQRMKPTPKNQKLLAQMNLKYRMNQFILANRGVKNE